MSDPSEAVRPLLRVRQVREFTAETVEADALNAIVDAARWSGSSQNTQPWRFILIANVEALRTLAQAGLPETRSLETAAAAVAIALPEAPGRGISHAYDEARAAERMLIAASFLGLGAGIAWIRPDVRPVAAQLLGVPDDWFIRTVIALGHPTEGARRPKSSRGAARRPRNETVFEERWSGS